MANPGSYPYGGRDGYVADKASDDPDRRRRAKEHRDRRDSSPTPAEFNDIMDELFRWQSLVVWSVVAAIFYFTPLWHAGGMRTTVWTFVIFLLLAAAMVISAPSSRTIVGGLVIMVLGGFILLATLFTWGARHRQQNAAPQTSLPASNSAPAPARHHPHSTKH